MAYIFFSGGGPTHIYFAFDAHDDNVSVYKTRFKKKMIDWVSVEELDWSA